MKALRDFLCLTLLQDALFWLAGGEARLQQVRDEYCEAAALVMSHERESMSKGNDAYLAKLAAEHEHEVSLARSMGFAQGQHIGRHEMWDWLHEHRHVPAADTPTLEDFINAKQRSCH
jgi:hypothetical protein